jgi:nicotinamide-nucleotide amidase
MKKASIISIGNELLNGQTTDTNATYLSSKLLSISIPVVSIYTIGDDKNAIIRAFNLACSDADVVIATGGLGPTDDDLTRQAFAEFLGAELQLQDELLQKIRDFFTCRNLQMPDKNKIQAYIPAGAKAIANNLGTAPGIMACLDSRFPILDSRPASSIQYCLSAVAPALHSAQCDGGPAKAEASRLLIVLPGVPSEMKQMFEESVLPELRRFAGEQAVVVRKLKCFGAGESTIAEMLGDMMQRDRNPLINCTVQYGIVTLHIIATAEDEDKARRMAENDEKSLRSTLGKLVYGTGEQTLAEVVGEKLARNKKTLAIAESCTGGALAKLLTDVPGASQYFTYGWVAYSNRSKVSELGVPADLIEKYGAVSEQVATAMAQGARKKAGTDFAIAITGIAGPAGGSEQKPVGLVYISVDSDNGCETRRYIFSHDRDFIRLRAAQTALNMLRLQLDID